MEKKSQEGRALAAIFAKTVMVILYPHYLGGGSVLATPEAI